MATARVMAAICAAICLTSTAHAREWFAWNGHEYTLVTDLNTWEGARNYAASDAMRNDPDGLFVGGETYLACITSAEEEQFIKATFCDPERSRWIGGWQNHNNPNYAEPNGGWEWVSGEPWVYTNWGLGEPNNQGSEDWLMWDGTCESSWWNDQYNYPYYHSIVEREAPPCDLCSANGCDYTCLNVDNAAISPDPSYPQESVTVSLDYDISGTESHIIYIGLVMGDECLPFYNGVPGQTGAAGCVSLALTAPSAPGSYIVKIAVAHVYNETEFREAVANGSADMLTIGSLCVTRPEDLNRDGGVDLSDLAQLLSVYGWHCD